ncbi:MAG: excinuclease ABC subunit UvrC [Candidatus Gracilibacteria bacterium]|nr:excinuclease ABC subunit UvrC [Candidatus Gracilibacteria bacterium]
MIITIKEILKNLPKTPGIYQFFNKDNKIIYIGKSVNLFSRVNSYFNGKSKLNFAKQKMVEQICDIKTILTNNETESLILETTLIKKHEPKYNILMKDGKNHIYIKITSEFIQKIIKVRQKSKTGTYFGPYTSTNYVNNILKLSKKIFGYRSCDITFTKEKNGEITLSNVGNTKTPCIDYYIKRCAGPCIKDNEKVREYEEKIGQIKDFFKGNTNKIKQTLETEMREKASKLQFEEAGKIKNDLDSLKTLEENQIVRDSIIGDFNIVNYIEKFEKFYIGMIEIRDSKITGFYNFEIKNNLEEDTLDVIKSFIESDFARHISEKNTYIIPKNIDFEIKEIKIEVPQIGNKKELLDLCYKNIYEYAYKSHLNSLSTKGFTKQTMINLLSILGYEQINKDILFECNDISHISGNHTVASRSIIENGKSNTSKYKKYKIKSLEEQKINDFDSMREVITRRLKEIDKSQIIPDLIIIDGGKGQLSSVVEILNNFKNEIETEEKKQLFDKIQIVSIAKREEELFTMNKNKEFERILLDKESNEIKLVQKIRDEAHRFAITFNRDTRIKAMKKNILESLPGFGPKTRSKLLKKYGNVEALKDIDIEELKEILNKTQIETLENHSII